MLNPDNKIILQKTPSLYFGYAAIFMAIVWIVSFIWIFFDDNSIVNWICTVSFFIFIPLLVFAGIIYLRSKHFVNSTVNQQYPENLDVSKTIHDAFIFVYSVGSDGIIPGLDNLICTFKTKKYPFKIYHCYNPEDFKAVLANENAKYLWIFGHGWRGGISFKWEPSIRDIIHLNVKKQTNFRYSDLIEDFQSLYPSKNFIAQFHCNHVDKTDPSNTSLPEILMDGSVIPEMYYVSDHKNNIFSIWFATRKLMRNIERKSIDSTEK